MTKPVLGPRVQGMAAYGNLQALTGTFVDILDEELGIGDGKMAVQSAYHARALVRASLTTALLHSFSAIAAQSHETGRPLMLLQNKD